MSAEKETLIECWAIIIMLGIAAYMFIRSHKKVWAGSVLPLLIVPAVNIIYSPISRKVMEVSKEAAISARIIIYLISFAVVCVWVVLWGGKLPTGKTKYIYICVSILFTFILLLIFLRNLVLRPLF
ncbi:putative membrane protein [[Clostridium] cellulosi]|mgnify:FL=1|uniref:Putative membrane protein n=1 Tax=[Clostridium] cellulosi TaxID=29343 RepID=A0A078KMM4_9FIRM|nr:putative membrane protein [[Clostridium] cellulosi]